MDITSFVTSNRDRALLIGDYNTYRSQLSRQLLSLRKRLGRTTPKNSKYVSKAPVTAADIAGNNEFVRLVLIQAERAWAQAMHMKSTHAENNTSHGIVGPTRRHIIFRLHKAYNHASALTTLLEDRGGSGASDTDFLEAQAYRQCLAGAEEFEKQSSGGHEDPKNAWKKCLTHFAQAHILYAAMLNSTQKDVFKEVLASMVDPSIRYAAYQSRLSRTIPVSTVARQHFPLDNTALVSLVEKLNPTAFEEEKVSMATGRGGAGSAEAVPTTITWRGRTAPIADAAIGQAMAATSTASSQLSLFLSSNSSASAKAQAAAYDPVLISAQDTVDAVRRSLGDLLKEGIPESDPRTQDLRVSDLAANHALISWRIGRNRILISSHRTRDDGAMFTPEVSSHHNRRKKRRTVVGTANSEAGNPVKITKPSRESKPHRLARLTERLVLYDSTLQSIDSIKDLRGASRDTSFIAELDGQRAYFQALRCINIAYSHSILDAHKESLALFARADEVLSGASSTTSPTEADAPPTLAVSKLQLATLRDHAKLLVIRQRGLVSLHLHHAEEVAKAISNAASADPLSLHLDEYPVHVDLNNIVQYPPKLQPVPVKPIFLDLAWNYIHYPGAGDRDGGSDRNAAENEVRKEKEKEKEKEKGIVEQVQGVIGGIVEQAAGGVGLQQEEQPQQQQQQGKKRGWFGFGGS